MTRKSKDSIIKELQKSLELCNTYSQELSKRLFQLSEVIDDDFEQSGSYFVLQEKLSFMTKLYNLNNSLYDKQKRQNERLKDRLRTVLYQLKKQGLKEYECPDFQTSELNDQIRLLKSQVSNRDETIQVLNNKISEYQQTIADLKLALSVHPTNNNIKILKDLLSEKSATADKYRNLTKKLLIAYSSILQQLSAFRERPTITCEQLNEVLINVIKNASDTGISQPIHDLTVSSEVQQLKNRITELEELLCKLAVEKSQYGRPPKFSTDDEARIITLIQEGWSYRKISATYGYSLGTISRLYQSYLERNR